MKSKYLQEINTIIMDIDGVIVGEKVGVNTPDPHPLVIKRLKSLNDSGIKICLCTAKPHFSIGSIIAKANLNNPHITDGGSLVINPLNDHIVSITTIDNEIANDVISILIGEGVYTEFYTYSGYYIQRDQHSDYTTIHENILQKPPILTNSLRAEANGKHITKIMPIVQNEQHKKQIEALLEGFNNRFVLSWGVHPIALPLQFGIITASGVSKKEGAYKAIKEIASSFDNTLGIGDSTSDWQFISLCKYAAAMGNASVKLKELIKSKGEKSSYVGPPVDQNGIIDIFEHFSL